MTASAERVHDDLRMVVNLFLHHCFDGDPEPCATACTHVVAHGWTALGIANFIARKAEADVLYG